MAPCTPRGAKPTSTSVINIIDSDDELNITQQHVLDNQNSRNISFSTHVATEEEKLSDNNEDLYYGTDVQFTAIRKRKRTQNVVTSDSESGDDNVPISKLKRMQFLKVRPDQVRCDLNELVTATSPVVDQVTSRVTPRRRLRKCVIKSQQDKKSSCAPSEDKHEHSLPTNKETNDDELEEASSDNEDTSSKLQDASDGEVESDSQDVSDGQEDKESSCGSSEDNHEQSIPINKETDDDESDEASSASEEGSLRGFIVPDSDVIEDTSSKWHDASDRDLNLEGILSQIQRTKDPKRKWEFEADMLAAFGKDDQLCMKAVCTLYRQQTSGERKIKGSMLYNGRGFSNVDAFRGSNLAEFLTDGDSHGDVKKSVKELDEYDPQGVEICRTMALRYSKQLFEIYKNKEDPFFP